MAGAVADEPVVLLFLSTLSDGRRLACYQEDPPRTDGVMVDQVGPVDPEAPFHGRKARDWPDGTYRVEGERLVGDEPPAGRGGRGRDGRGGDRAVEGGAAREARGDAGARCARTTRRVAGGRWRGWRAR